MNKQVNQRIQPTIRLSFGELVFNINVGEPFDAVVNYINNARQLRVNVDAMIARGLPLRGVF